MSRRNRLAKNRLNSIPELSMTPMIDVAFCLLIVFIISSPLIHHSIKINLPNGHVHEVKEKTKNTVIYIDKEGKLYLNSESLTLESLLSKLKKIENKDETIFIQGDKDCRYDWVAELIGEIKKNSGVTRVALATKKTATATVRV